MELLIFLTVKDDEQAPGTRAPDLRGTLPPSAADNTITLTVDDASFDAWNNAATVAGKLLRQWCVDVINESLE